MTGKHQPERNADVLRRAIAGEDYGSIGDLWGLSRRGVSGIVRTQAKRAGLELPPRPTVRLESRPRGETHYAWKGDAALTQTKRARAQSRYALGPCEHCGKPARDRHHKDGDTGNNEPNNIAILCRRCHMMEDGRLERLTCAKKDYSYLSRERGVRRMVQSFRVIQGERSALFILRTLQCGHQTKRRFFPADWEAFEETGKPFRVPRYAMCKECVG